MTMENPKSQKKEWRQRSRRYQKYLTKREDLKNRDEQHDK